jgi:hypothetical protein
MNQDFNPACLARQDTERIRRYARCLIFIADISGRTGR